MKVAFFATLLAFVIAFFVARIALGLYDFIMEITRPTDRARATERQRRDI